MYNNIEYYERGKQPYTMNILRCCFGNSGQLTCIQTNKFKRNLLMMTYTLPIDPNTTAFDELIPAVLLRGCKGYVTHADIKRRCEQLYGASLEYYYSYFGDHLMVNFCADFLSDRAVGGDINILRSMIELMARVWCDPVLDANGLLRADEITKTKVSFSDAILAADNDTAAYALRRTREIMCKHEPGGYSVSVEDIEKITPTALTERYKYLRCNDSSDFFYIGDADQTTVRELVSEYFGRIKYRRDNCCVSTPTAPLAHAIRQTESFPINQGKLTMGFTAGITMADSDYYPMLLAVEIFGGSPISKLFMNVRERLGLCYYCGASYSKSKGIVYVSSGIDPRDREIVETEILAQLNEMRLGNITDVELSAAQMSLINYAKQITDRPYSMWSFYNSRKLAGIDADIDTHIENLQRVTVSDIQRVVEDWKLGCVFFADATGGEDDEN